MKIWRYLGYFQNSPGPDIALTGGWAGDLLNDMLQTCWHWHSHNGFYQVLNQAEKEQAQLLTLAGVVI